MLKEGSTNTVVQSIPVPGYIGLLPHNIAEAKESFYGLPIEEIALSGQNINLQNSSHQASGSIDRVTYVQN